MSMVKYINSDATVTGQFGACQNISKTIRDSQDSCHRTPEVDVARTYCHFPPVEDLVWSRQHRGPPTSLLIPPAVQTPTKREEEGSFHNASKEKKYFHLI